MRPGNYIRSTLKPLLATAAFLGVCFGAADLQAVTTPSPPHTDYRPGYTTGCSSNGTACHQLNKGLFLPETLDITNPPSERDYTNFCLACHNATGEAHNKSVGAPSTNAYNNLTAFMFYSTFRGNSHSWKGLSHRAGTRTPTLDGFKKTLGGTGADYMPGGKVSCQVCHEGMGKRQGIEDVNWAPATDQGDHLHFTFGNVSTRQYLGQYIKVYRGSGTIAKPGSSRTRGNYLVSPSEYSYDYSTGTVTFKAGQPDPTYIYVDIHQPYFREDNTGNRICLDCHNDRAAVSVEHEDGAPGTGRGHHPVGIPYGKAFGSSTTLTGISGVKLYLEGGKVLCTTCHDPHNAASNDGSLIREKSGTKLCLDCHDSKKVEVHKGGRHPKYANTSTIPTGCTDCHTAHNTSNIYLVRDRFRSAAGEMRGVRFRNFTGTSGLGDDSGGSICEVCHTATDSHRADGSGKVHNPGRNCLKCHRHDKGFNPAGGGKPCYNCHDGSIAPDIKSRMGIGSSFSYGGKASRHIIVFDNQSTSTCLLMCHTGEHSVTGPNNKVTPEITLCNSAGCHGAGTDTTSRGRSIGVGAGYAGSMHNYTAATQDEFGLFRYSANCTKCHLPHGSDIYPMMRTAINGKSAGAGGEELCFTCHDTDKSRGASDIKSLWNANPANPGHYDYTNSKKMECVSCHGPHGTKNDKMVSDSLGGPGLAKDAICRVCHSGNGGSVYNVMGSEPGSYGPDFTAVSVHDFGLSVAIGGHTVDLTCSGCHDPHSTRNARLLQDKVVFSSASGAMVVSVPTVTAVVQGRGQITSYTDGWNSYCVLCHTQIGEAGSQSPYRRHPSGVTTFLNYSAEYHYYMRNLDEKPELKLESGRISCITCHYTHGSPQVSLLRFQNGTTPIKRMCLKCHNQGRYLGGGPGSHGGFLKNEGRCADCHSMHTKANRKLLDESTESVLCFKCHGGSGLSKYSNWNNFTTLDPFALQGTGGTFGHYSELRGGTAKSMHAINDEASLAPGGITTLHRCGTCHDPHGSKNYRIVRTTVNNVTGINVYAATDQDGRFLNYSVGFVKFCTACHASYSTTDDGHGNWIRHPVGVRISNYSTEGYFYANNTTYRPKVELESGGTISCVSCHFAHGSPADANLKIPGGKSVNLCKTCHNRDTFSAGSPGSHAGFTGNDGTCSDCHSMHADGNAKLLKSDAETGICVDCHDNPGTSTNTHASILDVWKGNVFGSPTSWFGTAGSFGTYDPVNGGDAPSMHPVNSDARIAPGDSATVVHCGTCHDSHGSTSYRLLKTRLNGKAGISVSANVDARGRTTSYIGGMSGFCTACHKTYGTCGSQAGYTRHPVDVALTSQEMANYNHFQGSKYLPLEFGNKVTCITCHFAHGSPYEKMKRLPGNQMCQTCHAKGIDPARGYADVQYTHGGFNGNSGNCGACHYMHRNIFNNVTGSLNRKLLVSADETQLCYGCHGPDGTRRGGFQTAQLVWVGDRPSYPTQWDKTGGSFGAYYNATTGGSIMSHHAINKTNSPAPGGTTTEHRCGTCHNPHGNNNYRLLRDDVNGRSGITIRVGAMGNYSTGMSAFCTACHTIYGETGSGVEGYRRHPINRFLTGTEMGNLTSTPLEPHVQHEGGKVMCLSCHYAHGSPSNAMLRMQTYSSSESEMCQQCHRKGFNADGQQVRYTHGGFNGNNANCRICHTVHSKGNKKLLMEPKESDLCNNCHAGIAKFNEFKSHDSDVKIDRPSRFNVFSSTGNSFGNYSVGGGDVASWHEIDGTHTAPGGKTLELRCGKCHNPHGSDNFTILRESVEGVNNIKVFGHVSSTGPFNTYSSGFATFCQACHTRLTRCGTGNPWTRHPVDFKLEDKQFYNWSTTVITPRVPLEAGSQVTCITCHNSHGSKSYSLQRQGGNRMCQQCHRR